MFAFLPGLRSVVLEDQCADFFFILFNIYKNKGGDLFKVQFAHLVVRQFEQVRISKEKGKICFF